FVGFKGSDWGMLRVGRFDTPFKRARGAVNYFGDQVGDIRNILRTDQHGKFDQRFRNSIHYRTPSFGGLTWDVQYSTDLDNQDTVADADDGFSTALNFKQGGFTGALAYEQQANEATEDADAVRLAAAYKLTSALEVGALYQSTEAAGGDEGDAFGVAAQYQFAPSWYLRGQAFMLDSDAEDSDATLFAVGIERRIDKDLRIRVNLAAMDNDDNSALTPWSEGGGPSAAGEDRDATGETAMALQLGIRYDF
ncbi:porin, partial [Thioalkalivibrio sp.]|uniref:porin n=1 Tax=Thioalkalivibrio sp. TaxID=2093813 RepID=UPI0039749BB5